MALKSVEGGILRNITVTVKSSVGESTEVLDSLLNSHKCLFQGRVEIQKILEPHPTSRKMGIFQRPRSVSPGDTPKS